MPDENALSCRGSRSSHRGRLHMRSASRLSASRRTIVIRWPTDVVFAFFTTPANDLRGRPHVKENDGSVTPRVGVASPAGRGRAGPDGRGIEADIEVTAFTAPNRYAFQVVKGPARLRGEFRFTSSGADTTEVTMSPTRFAERSSARCGDGWWFSRLTWRGRGTPRGSGSLLAEPLGGLR